MLYVVVVAVLGPLAVLAIMVATWVVLALAAIVPVVAAAFAVDTVRYASQRTGRAVERALRPRGPAERELAEL